MYQLYTVIFYRLRRDGRLSLPSWLTHTGQFTHKEVACTPTIKRAQGRDIVQTYL